MIPSGDGSTAAIGSGNIYGITWEPAGGASAITVYGPPDSDGCYLYITEQGVWCARSCDRGTDSSVGHAPFRSHSCATKLVLPLLLVY
jgi:hypothetical protein